MRLGYRKIYRMPVGYMGWIQAKAPVIQNQQEKELLGVNDYFPECNLVQARNDKDKRYLNLTEHSGGTSLSEIRARYLYVEIFNERCLGCIAEIKNYKTLYRKFKDTSFLSQNVKIIGIGAGSNRRGVSKFRKNHDIPFPLFSDHNWDIFECLGSPILPTSYLLKLEKEGRRKIIFVQRGHIEKMKQLIKTLVKLIH